MTSSASSEPDAWEERLLTACGKLAFLLLCAEVLSERAWRPPGGLRLFPASGYAPHPMTEPFGPPSALAKESLGARSKPGTEETKAKAGVQQEGRHVSIW